jgi:hypothetical protein
VNAIFDFIVLARPKREIMEMRIVENFRMISGTRSTKAIGWTSECRFRFGRPAR